MRGSSLIINLPGKPKSIRETFDEVFKSIPYCIQVITARRATYAAALLKVAVHIWTALRAAKVYVWFAACSHCCFTACQQ
jgi:hypothetical protein